jgi:hypothetical protein
MSSPSINILAQIEAIESAYEFMLAYAAQGRDVHEKVAGGSEIERVLESLVAALRVLRDDAASLRLPEQFQEFTNTLSLDARHASNAVSLVLSQARISSQLVDNLNASIHLRAVLTDIFLIDEALNCQ